MGEYIMTAAAVEWERQLMDAVYKQEEGALKLLADIIAPPIQHEFEHKNIVPLMLTEHVLGIGELARYQYEPMSLAWYLAPGSDPQPYQMQRSEIDVPPLRAEEAPRVDASVLRNGNVGSLADHAKKAVWHIRNMNCKKACSLVSAAVSASNIITVPGNMVTKESWNEALKVIEDLDLNIRAVVMRGAHKSDIRLFTETSPATRRENELYGGVRIYADAVLACSAFAPYNEVYIFPDMEVGKSPVFYPLEQRPFRQGYQVGWDIMEERGYAVTSPQWIAKIVLLGVPVPPTAAWGSPAPTTAAHGTPSTWHIAAGGGASIAAIAWGDGSADYVTLSSGLGSKAHTYASAATYVAVVMSFDDLGNMATSNPLTITVS